jgi:pimeloyl-ACP methyl ester carboxylesterase
MFPADADPNLVAWHTAQMASVPDHVARELLTLQLTMNLEDLLPEIAVPTLLLAASKSDRAGAGESEFMRERIPNARQVTIDSHHNISATMPEQCVEAILPFLRENSGS